MNKSQHCVCGIDEEAWVSFDMPCASDGVHIWEQDRGARMVHAIEVLLRAVADLSAEDRATARMAIDALMFHEGVA